MAEARPYNLRSGRTDPVNFQVLIDLGDKTNMLEQLLGAANDGQVSDISSDSSCSELDICGILNTSDSEQSITGKLEGSWALII